MKSEPIHVTFNGEQTLDCPFHTPIAELIPRLKTAGPAPYLGALVNNDLVSLTYPLEVDSDVRLLTLADAYGWQIYARSLAFLLAAAVKTLSPKARFAVNYAIGNGLYCRFDLRAEGPDARLTAERIQALEARMREMVAQDLPIERRKLSFTRAVRMFEEAGLQEKLGLLRFRNPPRVVLHVCDGFYDLAQGPLVPGTGALGCFRLIPYPPGLVLQLPEQGYPCALAEFREQPHLFQIFQEHKEWGRILGVDTVGRLNEIIAAGELGGFIRTAEALHEKKMARIADMIAERRGQVRVVLVAGPSSSGKTTMSKRLAVQLHVNGLRPTTLSLDDYFLGDDRTPRDAAGNPDFEHIEALDLQLFNEQLLTLIGGGEVQLPTFRFETRTREYRGKRLRLDPDQILIIEGIHGLNPRLTHMIPDAHKFRIYINALTQLGIDSNNRIPTTDNRLIRRLVRDHKFRGYPALSTLRMWGSVRRGEERWIYPFQQRADATFNSALDYELAVLKPLVEPLLMEVKPYDAEYAEARRLTAFLLNFVPASDRDVPSTSILREYVGRSSFRY